MTGGRMKTGGETAARLADRLAARGGRRTDDLAAAVVAWSATTGRERAVFFVEKRLSGLLASLFGRWAVPGSLGGEEIAPGVMAMTLASRADDDGRLSELAVCQAHGRARRCVTNSPAVSRPGESQRQ